MATLCQTLCAFFDIHFLSLCFPPVPTPFALAIQSFFWLLKQSFFFPGHHTSGSPVGILFLYFVWLNPIHPPGSFPCPLSHPQIYLGTLFMCFPWYTLFPVFIHCIATSCLLVSTPIGYKYQAQALDQSFLVTVYLASGTVSGTS